MRAALFGDGNRQPQQARGPTLPQEDHGRPECAGAGWRENHRARTDRLDRETADHPPWKTSAARAAGLPDLRMAKGRVRFTGSAGSAGLLAQQFAGSEFDPR